MGKGTVVELWWSRSFDANGAGIVMPPGIFYNLPSDSAEITASHAPIVWPSISLTNVLY